MKHLICALLLATFPLAVTGAVPEGGWYFNPAEPGRGFNIEIQGRTLFMAGFLYDAAGNPIWFVSGGPMSSDHTYSGAAFQTANGQPLGGSNRAPTPVPFGNAVVTFLTPTGANITVNGFSFTVTREIFGFDPAALYPGTWILTHTPTVSGGLCGQESVGVEQATVLIVDGSGNFFQMDDQFPTLLQTSGTIATNGSVTFTEYGDTLRPPLQPPNHYTCPAGSGSGTMTGLNTGSGNWSQGGSAGTFTLTRR